MRDPRRRDRQHRPGRNASGGRLVRRARCHGGAGAIRQRSAYRSHAWRDACAELGIRRKRTRPYRPQTNGKIERFHRTLADGWAYSKHYSSESAGRNALPAWLHSYNHHRPPHRDRRPPTHQQTDQPAWAAHLALPAPSTATRAAAARAAPVYLGIVSVLGRRRQEQSDWGTSVSGGRAILSPSASSTGQLVYCTR